VTVLRFRAPWGVLAVAASAGFGCSLVTSTSGLTGGGDSDAGAPLANGSNEGGAADGSSDPGSSDTGAPSTSDAGGGGITRGDDAGDSQAFVLEAGADVGADAANPCPDGGILCGSECIAPTDPNNCGACGNVCSTGLCGTTLAASMTSAPANWTFNGSATFDSYAPSAELTKASVENQAGTFLYDDPVVIDSFEATFQFRMGLQGGSRSDGMGFLIEQNGPTAVGNLGNGLGMSGLVGFGVELDIFQNGNCADSSDDHVGVDDLTLCPDETAMPTSLYENDVTGIVDLADTHWHTAEIVLASGAISMTIDGTSVISAAPMTGFASGNPYYLGFSAGTGTLAADDGGPGGYRQEVKNIVVTFPTPRCL
jgi:hypothetical protein